MDDLINRTSSCPNISSLSIGSSENPDDDSVIKNTLRLNNSIYNINELNKEGNDDFRKNDDDLMECEAGLYGTELSDVQSGNENVTVIFNWNYGGNEVYLVDYHENKMIKMIKSTNCFITIQELPKKLFKYRFLVDNIYQYSPEYPFIKTDDGFVNYIDITNFKSVDYTIPRNNQLLNTEVFGNDVPGPNYLSMEPPIYPDILNYRSPDIVNINRVYNDVHILSNHIFEDSESRPILGPKYKSYMCIYRYSDELTNYNATLDSAKYVTYIYVTFNEYNDEYSINEKLFFLNFFKIE